MGVLGGGMSGVRFGLCGIEGVVSMVEVVCAWVLVVPEEVVRWLCWGPEVRMVVRAVGVGKLVGMASRVVCTVLDRVRVVRRRRRRRRRGWRVSILVVRVVVSRRL